MLVDQAGNALFATPAPGYVPPAQTAPPTPVQTPPAAAGNPAPSPPIGPSASPGISASNATPVAHAGDDDARPAATALISRAEIAALLRRELAASSAAASIRALRSRGHFDLELRAPEAGSALVEWYEPPAGHAAGSPTPAPILVASGHATSTTARSLTIDVRLTAAGKRLARQAKRVALTAEGRFTPAGDPAVTVARVFELRDGFAA
jgi:hypothetical protein